MLTTTERQKDESLSESESEPEQDQDPEQSYNSAAPHIKSAFSALISVSSVFLNSPVASRPFFSFLLLNRTDNLLQTTACATPAPCVLRVTVDTPRSFKMSCRPPRPRQADAATRDACAWSAHDRTALLSILTEFG